MWEQRYGFPEPERTTAGYRVYSEDDVEALRRVLAYRDRGLSVPAAVERARASRPRHRPAVDLRRARRAATRRRARRCCSKRDADRALARDRGRDDLARGRAGGDRRLPARAQLPRASSTATGDGARPPTPCVVFADFAGAARRRRRARRGAARARATRSATSGRSSSTRPATRACLLAWEQPRARAACPTSSGASRRSGRSTRASCAGRRRSAARWRGRADADAGRADRRRCWPSGRWRWSSRRRR